MSEQQFKPKERRSVLLALGRGKAFTPSVKDAPELVTLLATEDEEIAEQAAKALELIAPSALAAILAVLPESVRPARARMVKVLGRLAGALPDSELVATLVELSADKDLKARLNAIAGLGRLAGVDGVEDGLLGILARADRVEVTKTAVKALGTAGGAAALAALEQLASVDAGVTEAVAQAVILLRRAVVRAVPTTLDDKVSLSGVLVHLFCRRGLERLLEAEAKVLGPARVEAPGLVVLSTKGGLESVFTLRLMEKIAFRLPSLGNEVREAVTTAWQSGTSEENLRTAEPRPRQVPSGLAKWRRRRHEESRGRAAESQTRSHQRPEAKPLAARRRRRLPPGFGGGVAGAEGLA